MTTSLRFYLSILFYTVTFVAISQEFSIFGNVVDSNNDPVELANVIILSSENSQFVKGTSTDQLGYFKLENLTSDTFIIRISFIGYQEFEQKIILTGDLDLKKIRLKSISESLEEVVVIGKKPSITRKPDRLIFNIENTALTEGSTLSVLKSTPGVIVSESGINIKSDQATVFINNRRVQLTSSELIQLLESAPANSIKSVEVITNPPASYDADSGSVINIIMSKNLVTGYRGSVQTNYTQGVFPRYNAGTSHYFKNNKINFNVNYNYTNQKINRDQDDRVDFFDASETIDQIWSSNVNRNTSSETHNLNLNFDYYIDEKNTLSLTSTGLYMPYYKYEIRNNTTIFNENMVFEDSFTADNLSRDNKYNIGTDLIFSHDFNDNSKLIFNAHYTTYDYNRDQKVFQDELTDEDSEFNTLANQNTNIISGKVDYSLPVNETSNFEAGIKYSSVKTDSDIARLDIVGDEEVPNNQNTDAFKYDENVFAGYTNFSKSWDKWDLNLGLRVEQTNIVGESASLGETNTQSYFNWFPNVGLTHNIYENISVSTSYKRSITRPNYTNLNPFTFFINENTTVVGNPNLVPTYIDNFKIAISFLRDFTFSAYYSDYAGAIEELPRQNNETNIIAFTPVNLDNRVDYGFDLEYYYSSNKFSLYAASSTYNISEEVNFGQDFVNLNRWSQIFILSSNLSLLKDNSLNINGTFYWFGKNLQSLQTVEDRLVSDISISKSILNNKGIISLAIQDIFNLQDYDTSVQYLNQSSRSFVDADNRTIKIGFRYKFGNTKLSTNERATSAEERERLKDLN